MLKRMSSALLAGACLLVAGIDQASAYDPEAAVIYARPPQPTAYARRSNVGGGGLLEFLFGERPAQGRVYRREPVYQQQPSYYVPHGGLLPPMGRPQMQQEEALDPRQRSFDPQYEKQLVGYSGREHAGTIVIDTPNKFLYLVQDNGRALRYGIGVGRPGFTWSGTKTISAKREWPGWTPPREMLARRPDLPRYMEGGPENPLGARAMYLGSSLYRIHGSNEPWTIGTNVSSGCIRMRNEDVIDLYGRVGVGTKVVVI